MTGYAQIETVDAEYARCFAVVDGPVIHVSYPKLLWQRNGAFQVRRVEEAIPRTKVTRLTWFRD